MADEKKEAVANTSSIIFIAKLNLFDLVKNIFSKILIPKEVIEELFENNSPENEIIKRELNNFLFEEKVNNIKELPIDDGEKAAISLCLEKRINLFLSDDKKARNYAKSLGIEVIGILGILYYNFKEETIGKKEFLNFLNKLIENGYYMSPSLYNEIIQMINS
jgi:predicted nucleic acid-binding protein